RSTSIICRGVARRLPLLPRADAGSRRHAGCAEAPARRGHRGKETGVVPGALYAAEPDGGSCVLVEKGARDSYDAFKVYIEGVCETGAICVFCVHRKGQRSYWIPGSYVTSNSMSAGSNALPRLRTLCTNSKNPR